MKISTKNNRKLNNHCQLVKQDKKGGQSLLFESRKQKGNLGDPYKMAKHQVVILNQLGSA
jgi:hypothetical protein